MSRRSHAAGLLMILGVVNFFVGLGHAALVISIGEVQVSRWEFPLWMPESLVADSRGTVYAGSAIGQRVQTYAPGGRFVRSTLIPTTKGRFVLGVDDQDRLWLHWARSLYGWDADGTLLEVSGAVERPEQTKDGQRIRWDQGAWESIPYRRGGLPMLPFAFPWTALTGVLLVTVGALLNPKRPK